jgi:hypothetical protein
MGRERDPWGIPRPGLEAAPLAALLSFDLGLSSRFGAGRLIVSTTLGSVIIHATYQALLTALRAEAMVRRGAMGRREQRLLVFRSVVGSVRQGAAVGLVLALLVLPFPWLSLPMAVVGTLGAGKASLDLFHAFWDGLDEDQRAELHAAAYRAGMNLGRLVRGHHDLLPET